MHKHVVLLSYLRNRVILTRVISILLLISFCTYTTGCVFYKARQKPVSDKPIADFNKYTPDAYTFLVHFGDETWQLSSVELHLDEDIVYGYVAPVNQTIRALYSNIDIGQTKVLREKARYSRQVHFYINEYNDLQNGRVSIQGSAIEKAVVYNVDGTATTLANAGIAALAYLVAVAIYIFIICNCPHVYAFDGEEYTLETSLFTGAVTKGLERHDYKIIPDHLPEQVLLKVVNEELELQHSDLLELLVVQHSPEVIIAPDAKGNIYSIEQPIAPTKVFTSDSKDYSFEISEQDDLPFSFNVEGENDLSDLYLTFDALPKELNKVNLLLNLKNTTWGGFVYKKFISNFGGYYGKWSEKSQNKPGDNTMKWARSQGIPLAIEMRKNGKWTSVGFIDLVGEINYTSMVLPIELAGDGKPIELRLRSGFMFWEVDYVAMDLENQLVTNYEILKPAKAIGQDGTDFKEALSYSDGKYMDHLHTGDYTEVAYTPIAKVPGNNRTLILHSKGYYQSNFNLTGSPQLGKLLKYRKEGELSRRSMQLYDDYLKSIIISSNE
ncbi:MAG: hypothetical protein RIA62_00745 [Cyclobacteriaceae bacterium]